MWLHLPLPKASSHTAADYQLRDVSEALCIAEMQLQMLRFLFDRGTPAATQPHAKKCCWPRWAAPSPRTAY